MERTLGVAAGRVERNSKWTIIVAYLGAASSGAVVLGVGVSLAGWILHQGTAASGAQMLLLPLGVAVMILAVLERDAGWIPTPTHVKRQVRSTDFSGERVWVTALWWGLQLGLGVVTRVNTWAFWFLLVLLGLVGRPEIGALAGFGYGAVRGSSLAVGTFVASTPGDLGWLIHVLTLERKLRITGLAVVSASIPLGLGIGSAFGLN